MASEIRMPQLSDTMESGKILHWKKSEGDIIKRGDSLAEVETEKANLDVEAFQEGVLLKIFVKENQTARVGDIIAVIGQAGESYEVKAQTSEALPQAASLQPLPESPEPVSAEPQFETTLRSQVDERIKVSPLARKIAEERQIDLRTVQGSGPDGRIIKRDLEAPRPASRPLPLSQSSSSRSTAPHPPEADAQAESVPARFSPLSKMRETIGLRMQQSVRESPHFYVTVAVNMSEALRLLQRLKEEPDYQGISVSHLIIKAAAYALNKEPRVNSSIREGKLFQPDAVNIGIITAVDEGLLIPVIRDVPRIPLQTVVAETRAAIERARTAKSSAADLSGGTFSISNLGMYDVEEFTAIINPGQGAVLAVASIKESPIVEDGNLVVAPLMRVTLSSDHRVIDGVAAANFLKFFKEALQSPSFLFS